MGKIYVGQTNLKLVLETGVDLTGATTKQIKYKKPTGDVSQLTASNEGLPTEGQIAYNFAVGDTAILSVPGTWKFWAYIVFADGRIARGETAELVVYDIAS